MSQEVMEWLLIIGRWVHITVAVTWIGTSIFFMWLDRTLEVNEQSKRDGHVGELWMVHGGGFYHVEKLLMGPTKVPDTLHWFKWESYWTWMSGVFLLVLTFYTGEGTFLLDASVSDIAYWPAVAVAIFSILGSWFFYDFLWERKLTREKPIIGHVLTLLWFIGMTYYLCQTLSGRAAYIHIGGMLGTWMTANVFMRIIPRQLKMVEASKKGEPVNQEWGKNAKNRSTHNTYFTLPVIFIMLSNHFPSTYGHELNWLLLILISAAGAAIREYFVVRVGNPKRALKFGVIGVALLVGVVTWTSMPERSESPSTPMKEEVREIPVPEATISAKQGSMAVENLDELPRKNIKGLITFYGTAPKGKKLRLPGACAKQYPGDVYSDEVRVNNGKLENVLVRIIKGHEGKYSSDIPSEPVELDQRGCIYRPRVIAVRAGQPVEFINSDPVFHNVRSSSKTNGRFNINMPKKDDRKTRIFTKPEITLHTKCSLHPWMGAQIAVVEHPYFSVSNDKGEFEIKGLPIGKYTIEAWHEIFGSQTREIEITENQMKDVVFEYRSNK